MRGLCRADMGNFVRRVMDNERGRLICQCEYRVAEYFVYAFALFGVCSMQKMSTQVLF